MKKYAVVGIVFLFIISSITPMVIGFSTETKDIDNELEAELSNLRYMCTTPDGFNEAEYESYKEELLNSYSKDDTTVVEPVQAVVNDYYPTAVSFGPMDSPWPMKCHDTRHTGLSPYSTVDNPYDEIWKFKTEGWMNSGIVLDDDGVLYFGSYDFYLYAVYPNGTLKWRYGRTGMWITSSPAIAEDGTVYIGSWDSKLYAVNPDGTEKWSIGMGGNVEASPAIAEDGTIYVGAMGPGDYGRINAVNPNGTIKWYYNTGYWITSAPAIADDGTIYIGSGDEYFYAMNPNGTLRWRFKTGDIIRGHPSIGNDGTVYFSSYDDYLYALFPNNGTMKWKTDTDTGDTGGLAIAYDRTIYSGTSDLYAINPNGSIKWIFDFGSNKYAGKSSPAISADGIIYISLIIGSDDGAEILAVNPDGTERWRKWLADHEGQSSPTIGSDGTVYVGSSTMASGNPHGNVHAFGRGELAADAHGPYIGIISEPVQFTGSASGGYLPYSFHWDFGDEETSEEQNPTHEYSNAGNYTVTLTVTDDNDTVSVDISWALIRESNDPPNTPTITGPAEGQYGEPYDYTFTTVDIDGDNVWYYVEWGDGDTEEWIGPYSSSEEVVRSHTWDEQGEFTLMAKAKDIFDAESDWGTLEVTMPINQHSYSFPLLQRLLERFPNAFPILRHLLEL